jgi:predicted ATPase
MFKSEIRDSTINQLLEKAAARNYGHYLSKLVLKKVRGFQDAPVSFDFPVTAIIGPNGGGKTTVLGAAACAYKDVGPKRFFAKSGAYDQSMQDWSIEYELVDRNINPRDTIRRTASFKSFRWRRDAADRKVLIFAVSRTVPASERAELLRCASRTFSVEAGDVSAFPTIVSASVSRILGKDVTGFRMLNVEADGRIRLLTGMTPEGAGYSEFHFGAGGSSIIRMVVDIEAGPDQTLVLIEEIENGLHPVATIRLVEYLIEVAERKRVQVVFTTHSNEALLPLPDKAVWVATQDRVFQGKLDIASLRAITGQITKAAVIFVEDAFAKGWVEAILRQRAITLVDHMEVHAMAGDGMAVAMNDYHNRNPAIAVPSVCLIDGDSQQVTSEEQKIYRFPGEAPDPYVFDKVLDAWDRFGGKLSVALWKEYERADEVKAMCEEVRRQNMDKHLLFAQLGAKLGLVPESTVMGAFCTIWAQAYPNDADAVIAPIRAVIPKQ